ncbi:MAG: aspartate carbamoyltransferase [Chloroflexota bacterium]
MSVAAADVRVHALDVPYTPRAIDGTLAGRHIVSVEQFARPDLDALFRSAAKLRSRVRAGDKSVFKLCQRRIMATLFFEASTRTDMSFQAAMLRLGGEVVATAGGVQFSSVYKGENLADTVRAAGSYADVIVLRHPQVRSSYEAAEALDQLASRLGTRPVVVSGGDGVGEHPTQALLDLFTIIDFKHQADGCTITLVGDLAHGRTVHSLAKLLALYGAADVRLELVSPESLRAPAAVLEFVRSRGVEVHETSSLDEVIGHSDVIYWTRVQQERFADQAEYDAIAGDFIMTPAVLARAPLDAILMHPLPRKHEMGTEADHARLDADPRSVYFHQMQNGMYVRMALLAGVLGATGG